MREKTRDNVSVVLFQRRRFKPTKFGNLILLFSTRILVEERGKEREREKIDQNKIFLSSISICFNYKLQILFILNNNNKIYLAGISEFFFFVFLFSWKPKLIWKNTSFFNENFKFINRCLSYWIMFKRNKYWCSTHDNDNNDNDDDDWYWKWKI